MPLSDVQLKELSSNELIVLALEEASETVHEACKAFRFGADGSHPDMPLVKNVDRLCREAEQLGAICRILGSKHGINYGGTVDLRHKMAKLQTDKENGSPSAD